MENNSIKRYEMVTLDVAAGATGTRFTFERQSNLTSDTTQDIIIEGIETFPQETVPLVPNGGIAVATMAQLKNSFLVLYVGTEESVHFIPMIKLVNSFSGLSTSVLLSQFLPLGLQHLQIQWEKSYVWAAQSYASETEFQFLFGVSYKKLGPGVWAQLTANSIPGM